MGTKSLGTVITPKMVPVLTAPTDTVTIDASSVITLEQEDAVASAFFRVEYTKTATAVTTSLVTFTP